MRLHDVIAISAAILTCGLVNDVAEARSEVLLQAFHWESYSASEGGKPRGWYRIVESLADQIAQDGFTSIWLPPPSDCFIGDSSAPHSRGYIPVRLYKLDTDYGTETELRRLIRRLKDRGVNAVADIVANHRGAAGRSADGCFTFEAPNWGSWAMVRSEVCGGRSWDTGVDSPFLDLDFTNVKVQQDMADWLKWLHYDIGFSGWRWDFAKGFSGNYVGLLNRESGVNLSIGEFWTSMSYAGDGKPNWDQSTHRQESVDWIDSTWKNVRSSGDSASMAFDFTTKGQLQAAVASQEYWRLVDARRRPSGLIGMWPQKAVTFIDNHDTGSTQRHWVFSDNEDHLLQGYAYTLTHPGVPSVFWEHFFHYNGRLQKPIRDLIAIRQRNNIQADSPIFIHHAENNRYAATIGGRVAVKMGSRSWSPGEGWRLATSGRDFAVWEWTR